MTFYKGIVREIQETIRKISLNILVLGTFQKELQESYPTDKVKSCLCDKQIHDICTLDDVSDNGTKPSPLKTVHLAGRCDYVYIVLNKGSTLAETTLLIHSPYNDRLVIFCKKDDPYITDFDLQDAQNAGISIHYYKDPNDLLPLMDDVTFQLQYRKHLQTALQQTINNSAATNSNSGE